MSLDTMPCDIMESIYNIIITDNETANDVLENVKTDILSDMKKLKLNLYVLDNLNSENIRECMKEHNQVNEIINDKIKSLSLKHKNLIITAHGIKKSLRNWNLLHICGCKTNKNNFSMFYRKCNCLDDENFDMETEMTQFIFKEYIGLKICWPYI